LFFQKNQARAPTSIRSIDALSLSLFLSLSLSLSSCLAVHLGSPPLVNRFFLSDALREVQRKEDERANEL